ncbi:putative LPS assembly protein LptD [Rurimicrobium arvi]|uniref:LPS assembly protein LptD n=2 Tax=Rurimicrobium arvi TaxID=2049916 RepID=A0ABP8MWE7_9BACT
MLLLLLMLAVFPARAQKKILRIAADTVASGTEAATLKADSSESDSVKLAAKDSLKGNASLEQLGLKVSPDALSEVVTSHAADSSMMDARTNNFILYGKANVQYDGRKLSADQIDFNQSSNIARAKYIHDTARTKPDMPLFEQGAEKFTYDSLQYNFKSSRAIVQNARSQYGEGYVHSQQVKRNADQSLYGWQNVYTTCSLPEPHFGIRTRKIKVIPETAIASGSANIEIEGVPTPLFLPFGYFPINNEKHRSGFILPTYTTEAARGLGLMNGGYYFSLNDYADLKLLTTIYTKGSYAIGIQSNYISRYQYNGQLQLNFTQNKTGESYEPGSFIQNDYKIYWVHNKDVKSRPGVSFNGKVDVQSQKYNSLNSYTPSQILQSSYRSNLTYAKSWPNKPYSLTLSATYEQNNISRQTTFNAPNASFFISNIAPFQRKRPVGNTRWYEKITGTYTAVAVNQLIFYDTAFKLNKLQFSDFQNGIKHSIPVSASYSVLRFLTSTFNVSYNEYWNTERRYRRYNAADGKIDTTDERGFFASRDFNAGITLATQIYGMKMFKRGTIRGIRHTIRPSVNLNYHPDFAKKPFNYGYATNLDTSSRITYLSPYEGSVLGGYPALGRNGSVGFTLNNNLQMKVRNKKDTATGFKNIPILDAFDIGTGYNLAVDSFQWQTINISARTNILNKLNVTASAVYDPYNYDYTQMRRTARTMEAAGTGLARLTAANVALNMSLRSKPKSVSRNDSLANSADYKALMRNNGYNNYVDFNIPWNLNFSYALTLTRTPSAYSRKDTSIVNQNIMITGDFNFTPRWKLGFSTGYNLVNKQVSTTSIDVYRDMHCWEMHLNLIPFGDRRSFFFTLNVKAQVLQDLKLTRRRTFFDQQ